MAGVSDKAFRLLLRQFGCRVTYTEMISAKGIVYENTGTLRRLNLEGEGAVVVQLFGREPEVIARAAQVAVARGAAGIDINAGCPMPKILRNREGAALMREPEQLAAIVKATVASVQVPVSVKMRAGWDMAHRNAPEVAGLAAAAGAAVVTVHGRTREQLYTGRADWDIVRQVKERLQDTGVAVVGNGDISNGSEAAARLEQTGCDAVMIGRAAQGNPWIFPQVRNYLAGTPAAPPSSGERLEVARQHLAVALKFEAEPVAVRQMRKILGWYARGLPWSAEFRRRLNTLTLASEIETLLKQYAQQVTAGM